MEAGCSTKLLSIQQPDNNMLPQQQHCIAPRFSTICPRPAKFHEIVRVDART
jgi:hypothetical protein